MKNKIINIIKKINLQNRGLHIIIISILTILCYLNTLNNDFAWDDSTFIVNWQGPKYIENISYLLEGLSPAEHTGVFRPARGIFYLLSFHIWGANPQGYHIQALLIQLTITLIFYLIVYSLSKDKLLSFLSSILFGTHPIHTEAISFITASFDTISFIFFGLAFFLYIKFDQFKEKKERIICLIGALLYGSIAILVYEMALSLPLICLSYDLIFKKFNNNNFKEKRIFYILFMILISTYGIFRFYILKDSLRGNFSLFNISFGLITIPEVYIKTLFLLVYPYIQQPYELLHLNMLFLFHNIPVIAQGFNIYKITDNISINDWLPILEFLLVLTVGIFVYIKQKNKLLRFSMLWIAITMLPSTNFIPKGQLFADRYVYLTSLGFCIILALIFCNILRFTSKRKFQYAYYLTIFLFLVTLFSYMSITYSRNSDWKNNGTLFNSAYYSDPTNVVASDSLAAYYLDQNQFDISLSLVKHILDINPQSALAYTHLGAIYQGMKNEELAKKAYFQAIHLNPGQSDAYFGLGLIALKEKKYKDAEVFFKNAILYNNKNPKAYYELADVYSRTNHTDLAINELKQTLELSPLDINANITLANLYANNHQPEEGVKLFSDMISLDPNNSNNYFLMGTYLTQIGEHPIAEKNLLEAITLNNNNSEYYNGLGVLYIHMNRLDDAIEQFQKSIQIDPSYKAGADNLKLALKTKEKNT